ncbi:hypothetical protein M0Q97_00990 [Candidatus Dojkabacteria bacterium]|jgi:hypothetical protein|nr:hypothetical protein [Candidatus Dojkabacteria bacterium]
MKKCKTKIAISIAISKNINEYLTEKIENKSKYIEYIIYKDLLKNNIIIEKKYEIWEI